MPPVRPIVITNTLGHQLEEFQPITPGQALVYSCGPTVYSYAHIGNFRAFIFADTLRRVLEYNGYQVRQIRNITDVGHLTNDTLGTGVDKMEWAARQQKLTPHDIAQHFTAAFHRDALRLNLLQPTAEPRATEYIQEMINLTRRLIEQGLAYESDGDVYFEVAKFPQYGKLSGNSVDDLIAGSRVEVGQGKRSPADFALWKRAEPDKLMRYDSPWGDGVPGWHLECSAMAFDLLGEQVDIHTGGEDHVFPHHEDEIAQSEGATGVPFAHYWMHNAFLQLAGDEKMSKSLGNSYTISDLAKRGIHPLSFRYYTFQANYRTPLSFSWEALEAAQTALYRIWESAAQFVQSAEEEPLDSDGEEYRKAFHEAINRDLDLPGTLAVLNGVVGSALSEGQKLTLLEQFDRVLALDLQVTGKRLSELRTGEDDLLKRRAEARSTRNWSDSDAIRAELAAGGLEIKDTPRGQRWVRRDVLPCATEERA